MGSNSLTFVLELELPSHLFNGEHVFVQFGPGCCHWQVILLPAYSRVYEYPAEEHVSLGYAVVLPFLGISFFPVGFLFP